MKAEPGIYKKRCRMAGHLLLFWFFRISTGVPKSGFVFILCFPLPSFYYYEWRSLLLHIWFLRRESWQKNVIQFFLHDTKFLIRLGNFVHLIIYMIENWITTNIIKERVREEFLETKEEWVWWNTKIKQQVITHSTFLCSFHNQREIEKKYIVPKKTGIKIHTNTKK